MLSLAIPRNGISTRLPSERPTARPLWTWPGAMDSQDWAPRADLIDSPEQLTLKLDMPGMSIDDIDVQLEGDVLTVRAERKAPERQEGEVYLRNELAFGSFTRSFSLPASVERKKIEAAYASGVLTVTMPKADKSKPHAIKVKAG